MVAFGKQAATAQAVERLPATGEIDGSSLAWGMGFFVSFFCQAYQVLKIFFGEWGYKIFLRLPRLWSLTITSVTYKIFYFLTLKKKSLRLSWALTGGQRG